MPLFSLRNFTVCCLLTVGLIGNLRAADAFRLLTRPQLISSERGEVTSYVVVVDTQRYTFLPPFGWNVSANAMEKTVTFLSEDLSASIGIKFVTGVRKTVEALRTEASRAEITARYPDSKIDQDFPCHTSGEEGVGFDLQRQIEGRPPISIRLAMVPFGETQSLVEFTLTTETRRLAKYRWTFGNLMTSFQIDPVGRPQVP